MPTYRVYLARPTTQEPVWDFARTIVSTTPQQALNDGYSEWVQESSYQIPPLKDCRYRVNLSASNKETKISLMSTDETNGVQYTLTVLNNSTNPTNIAVFQNDPDIGVANVFSLAWFAKFSYPKTTIKFNWTISYNFVWSQTGILAPGVVFDASQLPAAGLQTNNQILLDYDPINNAYFFNPITPTTVKPLDILRVTQSPTVPLKQASVGIGMSGVGTFVVQAQPNLTVNFTPHPKYYVVAGNFTQGQVLDISQTTSASEVAFPPGVYQMTAILNSDNTWTIQPTALANKNFLLSKDIDTNVPWGYNSHSTLSTFKHEQNGEILIYKN